MAEDNKDNSGLGGEGGSSPAFDFTKMLQQFKIPGVDFSSIIERERKNIEDLAEANRIAFEGWQNLVRRQSEILQDSMKRAVEDSKNQNALKNGAELARMIDPNHGRDVRRPVAGKGRRAGHRLRVSQRIRLPDVSDRIAFHPAIEMPRKANWTASQRMTGVSMIEASRSSVVAPASTEEQVVRPSNTPSSTPAW